MPLLRALLAMSTPPFFIGLLLGYLYGFVGSTNQQRIQGAITGFGNPDLFNFLAPVSVILLSILVLAKGPVSTRPTRTERAIVYWLPSLSLGTCVPFFSALFAFLAGLPTSQTKTALVVMGIVGAIWSAGFFLLLIAPAHASVFPREVHKKKHLYAIILISSVLGSVWFYAGT